MSCKVFFQLKVDKLKRRGKKDCLPIERFFFVMENSSVDDPVSYPFADVFAYILSELVTLVVDGDKEALGPRTHCGGNIVRLCQNAATFLRENLVRIQYSLENWPTKCWYIYICKKATSLVTFRYKQLDDGVSAVTVTPHMLSCCANRRAITVSRILRIVYNWQEKREARWRDRTAPYWLSVPSSRPRQGISSLFSSQLQSSPVKLSLSAPCSLCRPILEARFLNDARYTKEAVPLSCKEHREAERYDRMNISPSLRLRLVY